MGLRPLLVSYLTGGKVSAHLFSYWPAVTDDMNIQMLERQIEYLYELPAGAAVVLSFQRLEHPE